MNREQINKIAWAAAAVAAVLAIVSLFLPVASVSVHGTTVNSYSLMSREMLKEGSLLFLFIIVLGVVWAFIPKKWASIVSICGSLLLFFVIAFLSDYAESKDANPGACVTLLTIGAIVYLVASIVRLVTWQKKEKKD